MRRFAFLLLIAAAACHSPTNPNDDPASQPHGQLAGVATTRPNCPAPTTTNPYPTPPEAYKQRNLLVYYQSSASLLRAVAIASHGAYFVDPVPARCTVDLRGVGTDGPADLPKMSVIRAPAVATVNVSIDTGLRLRAHPGRARPPID